jgi:CHAT domain-containing protein/tetratricopeptide (TPR) repeat protein
MTGLQIPARKSHRATIAEKRAIIREIETAASGRHPAPRALGDLGALELATGHYDAAVQVLDRASRGEPSDVTLRADLDAAYLVRGRALGRPRDLVRALDRIGPDPSGLESAFNRALALDSLYLHRLAKDAWKRYLERDPAASSWGRLATKRLSMLVVAEASSRRDLGKPLLAGREGASEPPVASSRPEELQKWVEEQGLIAWTAAAIDGSEPGRRAAEKRLRDAAARLGVLSGDRLVADEVSTLATTSPQQLRTLAAGLREYGLATSWLNHYSFDNALPLFNRAAKRFRLVSSPRLWWAEAGVAHCQVQLERYAAARRRAERVLAIARRRSYVALEARCEWVLAQVGLGTLDLDSAERATIAFHEVNRRARNRTGTATASLFQARVEDELGKSTAAWFHRLKGFRDLAEDGSDERLAIALSNATFALAREGEFHAAVDFASETLAFDREQGTPLGLAETLWIRAMNRARAGDARGALADVREAETHLPGIDSAANRARLLAGLNAVEGAVRADSEPLVALPRLNAALAFLRHRGFEYGQAEILIDRARVLRHLGRLQDEVADLDHAARLVAAQRRRIRQPFERVSFFTLQALLADERVAACLRLDPRGDSAFWAADQAKGLLFLESLSLPAPRTTAPAQPTARLASRLGEADAILSYWSLPDSLLIWIVRRGEPSRLVFHAIRRTELSRQIADFVAAIEERADRTIVSALGRRLGESLILPVATALAGVDRLIVVPDRVVRAVPWSALEPGPGTDPLLRSFSVRICPSAATLGADGPGLSRRIEHPTPPRLLAIGDPEVTSPREAPFPRLPGASGEVEEIARLFAAHLTLTGREVTRGRFLEALRQASIVHVASHFFVDRDPGSSRILLAAAPGEPPESLSAEDIARLSLPRLRLAVLSGCATDSEAEPSLEGTFAAAGAFLTAGATATVASLWPVDDRVTAELMPRFYRELLAGRVPDDALRRAQIALLDSADGAARDPANWAAFQVVSLSSHDRELDFGKEKR